MAEQLHVRILNMVFSTIYAFEERFALPQIGFLNNAVL
jgi:hypothetical protein